MANAGCEPVLATRSLTVVSLAAARSTRWKASRGGRLDRHFPAAARLWIVCCRKKDCAAERWSSGSRPVRGAERKLWQSPPHAKPAAKVG